MNDNRPPFGEEVEIVWEWDDLPEIQEVEIVWECDNIEAKELFVLDWDLEQYDQDEEVHTIVFEEIEDEEPIIWSWDD